MDVSYFAYAFISWQTFGLFPFLVIMNSAISFCMAICSYFFWVYTQENSWVIWQSHVWPFEEMPNCFPKWLHHFTSPPAVYENSSFLASSPTLAIICVFGYGLPSACEVVSHCVFDSRFPDDLRCWASFHVFVEHIFFKEMSI